MKTSLSCEEKKGPLMPRQQGLMGFVFLKKWTKCGKEFFFVCFVLSDANRGKVNFRLWSENQVIVFARKDLGKKKVSKLLNFQGIREIKRKKKNLKTFSVSKMHKLILYSIWH